MGSQEPTAQQLVDSTDSVDDQSAAPRRQLEEFVIPALLLALGAYLTHGLITMEVPASAGAPGPRVFPTIITALIFVVATYMIAKAIIGGAGKKDRWRRQGASTDWRATGTVVVTLLVFAAVLIPLGWIVAGALLFWGVARGLGSRRPLLDLYIALGVSCSIQLAFSAGLGLRLPPGILVWF